MRTGAKPLRPGCKHRGSFKLLQTRSYPGTVGACIQAKILPSLDGWQVTETYHTDAICHVAIAQEEAVISTCCVPWCAEDSRGVGVCGEGGGAREIRSVLLLRSPTSLQRGQMPPSALSRHMDALRFGAGECHGAHGVAGGQRLLWGQGGRGIHSHGL